MMMRKTLSIVVVVYLGVFMFMGLISLPDFGDIDNRHVAEYYINKGVMDTGSANLVNSIIWDFRGYDTLGEETVLFAAAMGVFLVVRKKEYGHYRKKRK